jgi:hypothetical protein
MTARERIKARTDFFLVNARRFMIPPLKVYRHDKRSSRWIIPRKDIGFVSNFGQASDSPYPFKHINLEHLIFPISLSVEASYKDVNIFCLFRLQPLTSFCPVDFSSREDPQERVWWIKIP